MSHSSEGGQSVCPTPPADFQCIYPTFSPVQAMLNLVGRFTFSQELLGYSIFEVTASLLLKALMVRKQELMYGA